MISIYLMPICIILGIGMPLYLIYFELKKRTHKESGHYSMQTEAILAKQKLTINAYERLALLCERIQPDQLAQRLQSSELSVAALSQAMIVAVQQEFDHNITQQIFVSDELWDIICLAREEALFSVLNHASKLDQMANGKLLTETLLQSRETSKINMASKAIRNEAKIHVYA